MNCDYLIVGQGLAGSSLAARLMGMGRKVKVIDDGQNISSWVAAGVFNPITGRRLVKTWKANTLFPSLLEFYQELEDSMGSQFLYERPVYRIFKTIEQQNEWMGKSSDPDYQMFIKDNFQKSGFPDWSYDPYGGVLLDQSGYLDVRSFLSSVRNHLDKTGSLISESFNYNELEIKSPGVIYRDLQAGKIVFCEGTGVMKNPYFNKLPFRPTKGEILEIELEETPDVILNKGVFMLPLDNKKCLVGSTYEVNEVNLETTQKGRDKLIEGLSDMLKRDYEIVGQRAGIRPATRDRRPILGSHPGNPDIVIFNGLGSKGVSLAPFFSSEMAQYLENGKELDAEISVTRFFRNLV